MIVETPDVDPTDVETLLPGPAARGYGLAYARAVWSGLTDLETEALELREGLHDLGLASGLALDVRGDWVGERRQGLDDAPYRRIIRGREVAIAGGVTPPAVVRGWRALTGDEAATLDEEPGEVLLIAVLTYPPDEAWLARAAVVTRDLVGNGRQLYAQVATPTVFRWGVSSYSGAGFSYDFGSE